MLPRDDEQEQQARELPCDSCGGSTGEPGTNHVGGTVWADVRLCYANGCGGAYYREILDVVPPDSRTDDAAMVTATRRWLDQRKRGAA